jgi:hypothetical protein
MPDALSASYTHSSSIHWPRQSSVRAEDIALMVTRILYVAGHHSSHLHAVTAILPR